MHWSLDIWRIQGAFLCEKANVPVGYFPQLFKFIVSVLVKFLTLDEHKTGRMQIQELAGYSETDCT